MPRDGSGNYTLPAGNPVSPGATIESAWANSTMDDLAVSMTDSLSRTGSGSMLVPFQNIDGTEGLPGITWAAEPTSGIFRATTGDMRFSILAAAQARITAANQLEVFRSAGFRRVPDVFSAETITGNWIINGAWTVTDNNFSLDATVNGNIGIAYHMAGIQRWQLRQANSAGLNDFALLRYDDSGVFIDSPWTASEADGSVTFANSVTYAGSPQLLNNVFLLGQDFAAANFRNLIGVTASDEVQVGNPNYTAMVRSLSGVRSEYAGTAALPAWSFTGEASTGMYLHSAANLAFATLGVQRFLVSSAEFNITPPVRAVDGSAATPTYSFSARPTIGMYASAGDRLNWSTAGVQRAFLDVSQFQTKVIITNINGTAAAPSYTFASDLTTGMYRDTSSRISFGSAGVFKMLIDSTHVEAVVPFVAPIGLIGTPSFTFAGDNTIGFFQNVNGLTAVMAGNTLWAMSTSGMFAGAGLQISADGDLITAAKPGFAFGNDADSGLYRASANSVTIAVGGSTALNFDLPSLAMWAGAGFHLRLDGAVDAVTPALSFTNDTDTGIYRRAANALGFSTAGVEKFNVGTGGIGVTSGFLCFFNLPTSPGTSGSLWADAGTVKVA